MKTKSGFMLRQVGGKNVVVAVGKAAEEFNGLITLNSTGAFLWEQLSHGISYDELLGKMLETYDVTEMAAKAGVDRFLENARGAGLIDD